MPRKDREERLAYQREWYSRPENRAKTIASVAKRKKEKYRGTCKNCGGPTQGNDFKTIPSYCGKPACRSIQNKRFYEEHPERRALASEAGRKGGVVISKTRRLPQQVGLVDLYSTLYERSTDG